VEGEEEDEELWLLKCPINICQSGTSPFFEGEAELQNPPNIAPVCQQTFTSRRMAAWNEPMSIQLFPIEYCFDILMISIKGSFPMCGTLLFKQGEKPSPKIHWASRHLEAELPLQELMRWIKNVFKGNQLWRGQINLL